MSSKPHGDCLEFLDFFQLPCGFDSSDFKKVLDCEKVIIIRYYSDENMCMD